MARGGLITRGIIVLDTEGVAKKIAKTTFKKEAKPKNTEGVTPSKKKAVTKAATPKKAAKTTHISNVQNSVQNGDNEKGDHAESDTQGASENNGN